MKPDLPCLIVPVSNGSLIFPENMLAEVKSVDTLEMSENELIAWYDWSGRKVPVVNFERLCNQQAEQKTVTRIAIMHTVLGHQSLPFVALQSEGIPHPVAVNEELLQKSAVKVDCPYVASYAQVSNLPCIVPDWPRIEEMIA